MRTTARILGTLLFLEIVAAISTDWPQLQLALLLPIAGTAIAWLATWSALAKRGDN
jgi:hypothetical protein